MLPYPTDRRRLLMMVRAFLHEFSEFIGAHADGWQYPSDPRDECADHQLEEFLERLAVDADQIDEAGGGEETEAGIQRGIEQHLCELLENAAWNRSRMHRN